MTTCDFTREFTRLISRAIFLVKLQSVTRDDACATNIYSNATEFQLEGDIDFFLLQRKKTLTITLKLEPELSLAGVRGVL